MPKLRNGSKCDSNCGSDVPLTQWEPQHLDGYLSPGSSLHEDRNKLRMQEISLMKNSICVLILLIVVLNYIWCSYSQNAQFYEIFFKFQCIQCFQASYKHGTNIFKIVYIYLGVIDIFLEGVYSFTVPA